MKKTTFLAARLSAVLALALFASIFYYGARLEEPQRRKYGCAQRCRHENAPGRNAQPTSFQNINSSL